MTFAEMRTAVTDYCHLTSADAILRVGKSLNRHYRRVTSLVGLDTVRFVTRIVSIPIGVRTVTFPEIEKIDRIVDATAPTAIRTLTQVSMNVQRSTQPGNSAPSTWAFQNADADSATVLLDTVPQAVYSLQADGWSTLTTMVADSDEPVFPESFHDLLVWFVISEELLKKEKDTLADRYQARAEKLLADLRFHLADTHSQDTVQASADRMTLAGGFGGGGGGTAGVTGYVTTAGTPVANQVAVFTDADTITGRTSFIFTDGGAAALSVQNTLGIPVLIVGNNDAFAGSLIRAQGYAPQIELNGKDYAITGRILLNEPDGRLIIRGGPGTGTDYVWLVDGVMTLPHGKLQFPSVQIPSADATTLDDYREGTFTPTITGSTSTSGVTYSVQVGEYTKIGNRVITSGHVVLASAGTMTGIVQIGGFPFAKAGGVNDVGTVIYLGMASPISGLALWIVPGTTVGQLIYTPAGGGASQAFMAPSQFAAGTDLTFQLTYRTA